MIGPVALSEPELVEWGERIGREAEPPLVLALRGELGAGKSVLARAVARGAGVDSTMPSPTFNLAFRYDGRDGIDVWHLDLYRLEAADEVWELGWAELGEGRQLVLIEWPERAEALLPGDRWDVWLEMPGPGSRSVAAAREGERSGRDGRERVQVREAEEVRIVRAERRGGAPAIPAP